MTSNITSSLPPRRRGIKPIIPMSDTSLNHTRHIITTFLLAALAPLMAGALTFSKSSVLSEGRWLKVRVDTTGVYRLSHKTLAEWGFADPSKVSVAGYGSVERAHSLDTGPDDLPLIPVMRGGDAIYFYAEGHSRLVPNASKTTPEEHINRFSSDSFYFLTDRRDLSSPEIETIPFATADANATSHTTHLSVDRRRYRAHTPQKTGVVTYSHDICTNGQLSETWDLSDCVSTPTLTYRYIGLPSDTDKHAPALTLGKGTAAASTTDPQPIRGTTNGNVIYIASTLHQIEITSHSGRLEATVSDPGGFDYLAVDHMTLRCERSNTIKALPAAWDYLNVWPEQTVALSGVPDGMVVWDVTSPRTPSMLGLSRSGKAGTAMFNPNPLRKTSSKTIAFVPSAAIPEPEPDGEVAPQNLHALPSADMLIVAADLFYSEALRLADIHSSRQGLRVAVVRQEEVFNEFSSGAYHPNGLRRMVNMMASRTDRPLRHLLLMGFGQGQPLRHGQKPEPYKVVSVHTEYTDEDRYNSKNLCGDAYYGIITDRMPERIAIPDIPVTVNVGRALLRTAAEARDFVDKCEAYLDDPALAGRPDEALIISGLGDGHGHISSTLVQEQAIKSRLPFATVHNGAQALFTTINQHSNPTSPEAEAYNLTRLSGSQRYVNYSGHSAYYLILGTLNISRVKNASSFNAMPVVFFSSCHTAPIDEDHESWGSWLISARRGPIAVIGASREVYMNCNHTLNTRFTEALADAAPGTTLGDIYTKALNSSHAMAVTATAREQATNNFCYNFIGNPALPARAPSATAAITAVDGKKLRTGTEMRLPALAPVKVEGIVGGTDGTPDATFSGTVSLQAFKPSRKAVTRSTNPEDIARGQKLVDIDEDKCIDITAPVRNGRWSLTLVPSLPDSIGHNRISLYAISADGRTATGGSRDIVFTDLGAAPGPGTDTKAPEITVWLDRPGSADGCVTGPAPLLHVSMSDEGGIEMDRTSVGRMPEITLDGKAIDGAAYSLRPGADGSLTLERELSNLADGFHEIRVRATDYAGNTAVRTFTFQVETGGLAATLIAGTEIARDAIEFTLDCPRDDVRATRLIIRDSRGNTVHSPRDISLPYTWDLRDASGAKVPDGSYTASLLVEAGWHYTSTPAVRFTIVKKQ